MGTATQDLKMNVIQRNNIGIYYVNISEKKTTFFLAWLIKSLMRRNRMLFLSNLSNTKNP